MSNPYINPSVKCAVRWYRKEEQRTRHTVDCKAHMELCPFAIIFPTAQVLPFQIIAGVEDTFGQSVPTQWHIRNLAGDVVANLSEYLIDLSVEQFTEPNRDYIILDEPITLTDEDVLAPGLYEMTITTAGGTYYSETFRVCADVTCLHKFTWSNCGDVGTQRYLGRSFTNILYLDKEVVEIGKPVPEFKIQTEQDKDGKDGAIFTRKIVRWALEVGKLPWYLLDALTEIPLHDTVTLQLAGETGEDILEEFSIEGSWEGDVCMANAAIGFIADEASLASGCCESFDVACPTPCLTADGVLDVHTPEVGDVFLLRRGQYATFYGIGDPEARDADGFGGYSPCPQRFAQTTQLGWEYAYYAEGSWHAAVYINSILGYDCVGTLTIDGNMMAQFGAQFQYSSDLITWTDIGPVFTSQALGSGVDITDVPDGANYFRIKMVGAECIAAYSQPLASPCAEGVDLTFGSGGLNNIVLDLIANTDGIYVAGSFTQYGATTANRFTRLKLDGSLDTVFNTALGSGFDNNVSRILEDASGNIICLGGFTSFNGTTCNGIARIKPDGTLDTTLVSGTGFNFAAGNGAVLPSGVIIVAGAFTTYNGTGANRIVGLNPDGSINVGFAYGTGFNSTVGGLTYDATTNTILASSRFASSYNGSAFRSGVCSIVRINLNGTYNSTVALETDATTKQFNDTVRHMWVDEDGNILCSGDFTVYDGVTVGRFAKISGSGVLDTAFEAALGSGFSAATTFSTVDNDGNIIICLSSHTATLDSNATNGLVLMSGAGVVDTDFDAVFDAGTTVVDVEPSALYVGGNFQNVDSISRKRVVRILT